MHDSDQQRSFALRNARTRADLVHLCLSWKIPYLDRANWERKLDTDFEDWFQVMPIHKKIPTVPPYYLKKLVVIASADELAQIAEDIEFVSNHDHHFLLRERSRVLNLETNIKIDLNHDESTVLRQESSVSHNSNKLHQGMRVLEIFPSQKLIDVRHVMHQIEEVPFDEYHAFQIS